MQSPIRRSNSTSRHKQKGVVAIEFALGFMAFWLMCMAWVEMSYMSYVSAICDVTIAQAASAAKKTDLEKDTATNKKEYLSLFQNALKKNGNLWGNVVDTNKFHTSVRYLSSVEDLAQTENPCIPDESTSQKVCGTANNSAIAIYHLTYDFKPIFTFFMDGTTVFSREVIVIQEYERTKFEI
jgi:tight adherence protein E